MAKTNMYNNKLSWYDNPEKVNEFANAYESNVGFMDKEDVLYYYEKPYKYDDTAKGYFNINRNSNNYEKKVEKYFESKAKI